MMIEVLYFEGCPNLEPTLSLANEVLSQLGLSADIREVEVRTPEDAEQLRSPKELLVAALEARRQENG